MFQKCHISGTLFGHLTPFGCARSRICFRKVTFKTWNVSKTWRFWNIVWTLNTLLSCPVTNMFKMVYKRSCKSPSFLFFKFCRHPANPRTHTTHPFLSFKSRTQTNTLALFPPTHLSSLRAINTRLKFNKTYTSLTWNPPAWWIRHNTCILIPYTPSPFNKDITSNPPPHQTSCTWHK